MVSLEEANLRAAHAMTEAQLQDVIVRVARLNGWLVFHDNDARKNEPGFPDIIALRNGRGLALELKTMKGKLRPTVVTKRGRLQPGQQEWLDAFKNAIFESRLVRPTDEDDILALLRA